MLGRVHYCCRYGLFFDGNKTESKSQMIGSFMCWSNSINALFYCNIGLEGGSNDSKRLQ